MLIVLMTSDRAKNQTVQSSLETAVLDGLLSRSALTTRLDEGYHLPKLWRSSKRAPNDTSEAKNHPRADRFRSLLIRYNGPFERL
jgi:hypothetical protein